MKSTRDRGKAFYHGLLGAGSHGRVYLALDSKTQQLVAIKVLNGGIWASPERYQRFAFEAKALSSIQHRSIVGLRDCRLEHNPPYLVLNYVVGLPITEYVSDKNPSLDDRLALMLLIVDAVAAAHAKDVIHRDLK
ncbi:MAG: protein kinase, partial [Bryobacteraceae bacterium]